ncbi:MULTISPECIES: sigma-54 dependent transcriptional regulator [Phaeodactylibacter]|jgi:DNA-binding NtrC family response regulator|uniref:sigma-54-dependent transcriptional regulator n=1 Tax=Phaeodactylibacter TaxID=1564515 RepID=UPI0024A86F42|nr:MULTISPECIES: sigma-54 dependent transcriptional regulator [Phaeodactylibacter]MCI4650096.1 sigma-54 dependent transcriptional regulator [Phaeodactylibacter sp.]MCI5091759.1 sigma-54 dependent transcriptional regulator [Phaeodactylibacter sp.]
MAKVLIVDDEKSIRRTLRDILEFEKYEVEEASDGMECLVKLKQSRYDVVIMDIKMPKMDGMEALERVQILAPDTPVVMISGHANIDTAVEAVKKGAFDFISKPPDLNRLLITIRNAMDKSSLVTETKLLKRKVSKSKVQEIIGESEGVQEVKNTIDQVGPTDARVLILGPNGTGKELVARWLHEKSARSDQPIIEVNCAAIPAELIESELFGHEKGAFTSAHKQRIGKFEQANGGTLFLDEIGDMSLSAQAKVLRALQESRITRVGGDKEISVDVRVVAATNKDLRKEIEEGRFREDLYHRLAVIIIRVPSLNDRKDDIPTLARHFVKQVCQEYGVPAKPIAPSALERLKDVNWTGNIRELRNAIERLVILSKDRISEGDVEHYVLPTSAAPSQKLKDIFARFESKEALLDFIDEQFAVYQKA